MKFKLYTKIGFLFGIVLSLIIIVLFISGNLPMILQLFGLPIVFFALFFGEIFFYLSLGSFGYYLGMFTGCVIIVLFYTLIGYIIDKFIKNGKGKKR
jgi:hypothetical protein